MGRAELLFAGLVPCDVKSWLDRDGPRVGQPEIVRSSQSRECASRLQPQTECQNSREQPHGAGLEPEGAEKLSPQA
jgi:hypothetical protein